MNPTYLLYIHFSTLMKVLVVLLNRCLMEAIRLRRSVRRYRFEAVPNDVLTRLFEAFSFAPSAHNAQPWHLILIKDPDIKLRLAEGMGRAWRADLEADGVELSEVDRRVKESIRTFFNAPALIVVCLSMEDMHKYPDERRSRAEYVMGVQSVAAAIQNLLLEAYAEGLGACWFCAPLFCQEVVRDVLGIPKQVDPLALITLGYPAEEPKPPPRKSLSQFIHFDRW